MSAPSWSKSWTSTPEGSRHPRLRSGHEIRDPGPSPTRLKTPVVMRARSAGGSERPQVPEGSGRGAECRPMHMRLPRHDVLSGGEARLHSSDELLTVVLGKVRHPPHGAEEGDQPLGGHCLEI